MQEFLNNYLKGLNESITIEFVIKFIIVYFFIIWISLVVWVLKDIRNRSTNVVFQIICLLISVIPLVGIFVYLLIRPSRTLYEKYYEEIEENLDIINEIIEERKKQFESKVNKSIEKEKKIIENIKSKNISKPSKKINFKYNVEVIKSDINGKNKEENNEKEKKSFLNENECKVGKKEIRITQIKKRNF